MTGILKVDTIQKNNGATPTAKDLGINVTGNVLQIVSANRTNEFTTTSSTYVDIVTLNITPSALSSRILLIYHTNGGTNGDVMHGYLGLFRGSTEIFKADSSSNRRGATAVINTATQVQQSYSMSYIDSPNSTTQITYRLQALSSNGGTLYINRSARDTDQLAYDGRSVTTLTALEIAA